MNEQEEVLYTARPDSCEAPNSRPLCDNASVLMRSLLTQPSNVSDWDAMIIS